LEVKAIDPDVNDRERKVQEDKAINENKG